MTTKVLMRIVVTEDDERVTVHLNVADKHMQDCPACLSLTAMRIQGMFLDTIERMREDACDPVIH